MAHRIVNGEKIELTQAEISVLEAEWAANKAKSDAIEYLRKRENAYPSIDAQLDKIFHEGLNAWMQSILRIKSNFPAPGQTTTLMNGVETNLLPPENK